MNFNEILDKVKTIHEKKDADYSAENDKFFNFKFVAEVSKHFHSDPVSTVFVTLIALKIARLASLQDKIAKNESTFDSHEDLITYTILWYEYELSKTKA